MSLATLAEDEDVYEISRYPLGSNCNELIKNYIANFTREELLAFDDPREGRPVIIPRHVENFTDSQVDKWTYSMLSSFYFNEKQDYIITKNPDANARYKFLKVAPVDYKNTGVIQHELQWSDGLHQFLQIKHGITLYPENVVTTFMSYYRFFSKYTELYGLTGTLGTSSHHQFLEKVYGVELSVIPTFIEKDLSEFQSVVVETKEQWYEEVTDVIKRKIDGQRAGLIILETMAEVENLKAYLEESGYNEKQIFVYGANADEEYPVENKRELEPGDVIIATNLAGRGTDLKISAPVKRNGGLHVIMGMFSPSERVADQGFGRGARQGEPGSAQAIVCLEEIPGTQCKLEGGIECLKAERNREESESLERDRLCVLPGLELRDKAFEWYLEVNEEVVSPTGYKLIAGEPTTVYPKSLYLFVRDDSIGLKIVKATNAENARNEDSATFDVTDLVSAIDPRSAKHIKTAFSRKGHAESGLNKQDREIMHFITAVKGYTDYPELYKRVQYQFKEEVSQERLPATEFDDGFFGGLFNGEADKFSRQERAYLEKLLEKREYVDLLSQEERAEEGGVATISEATLAKAKMRKLYEMWVASRELYNNQYESRQIKDDFGMFLKKNDPTTGLARYCNISDEAGMIALNQKDEELLKKAFGEYKAAIKKRIEDKNLIQNPNYEVLKAFQYYWIYLSQSVTPPPLQIGITGYLELLGLCECS